MDTTDSRAADSRAAEPRAAEPRVVVIDHGRCQGHGRCYDLAPEVFGSDGEGYATLVVEGGAVPEGLEERTHLAVANCPEGALDLLGGGPR